MAEEKCWSSVNGDMGYVIFSKLSEAVDRVRFGAVCKGWHHIAKDYNPIANSSTRTTLPMLLIPDEECLTQRTLYSVSTRKVYSNVRLKNIPNKRYIGFSRGWLAFVDTEDDYSVTFIGLFKFKGNTIRLPKLDRKPWDFVKKLIISPDSTPENYTVVAAYVGFSNLAIIRTGDKNWTYIDDKYPEIFANADIVFHNGLIYSTDYYLNIVSTDISVDPPKTRILKGQDMAYVQEQKWSGHYIVESTTCDLYLVKRDLNEFSITVSFEVFKVEFHPESGELIRLEEVNTLGGDAFFIGQNDNMSVKASDYEGCVPNSIYFVDESWGCSDNEFDYSGVYHVEEKTIVRFHPKESSNQSFTAAPIWVQPSYN